MATPLKYVAKNGKVTYRVRFRLNSQSCSETFNNKKEAIAFCSDIDTRDVKYALRVLHEKEKATTAKLDVIAESFFDWKETKVRSDRTVMDYRRDYKKWISPHFGDRVAGNIDESDVQVWVDLMVKGDGSQKGLSPKSVMDRHALLHSIYSYALAPSRRLVEANPCIGTELPKRRKGSPKGLKPAEWLALYSALATIDQDAADLALFMLATGWRWSEATALSAYDVWVDQGSMYVTVSHVVRRNAAGQQVIVEDTKSEAGQRRITVDSEAAEMITRRLDRVKGDGLVFTNKAGLQWHYSNFRNRAWTPAVSAAQLSRRPSPHWLRHTHVAWMVMSGGNLPELKSRIGHESISTTIDVYGRMSTDVSQGTLKNFAQMRKVKAIEN